MALDYVLTVHNENFRYFPFNPRWILGPLTVPLNQIASIKPLMTMVGGRIVYDSKP